jgi:hypothetical protein
MPTWIKLAAVNGDKRALDIEFTFRENIPIQHIGPFGYRAARMFLAALNVGSTGFWWWQCADQTDHFYERLIDLQAAKDVGVEVKMQAWPKFEWQRVALREPELHRTAMCFGMIAKLDKTSYEAVIEPYLTGLAMVGKSDLHFNFALNACERFANCLLEAMRHFGAWDGSDSGIRTAISGFVGPVMHKQEDVDELVDLLGRLRRQPQDVQGITLERAAILKVLCDAYLIKQFEKMAQEMAQEVAELDVSMPA